ncbi:MAG TPA: site-2 protease family protein [Candidatus Dormibacteraeota bacterium]|nr:site-2 protease family protein [Candidatus Dormibacteraeota bacterium]
MADRGVATGAAAGKIVRSADREITLPPLFKFANPIRFDKHTKIGQIRGADLCVHWTVFLVAAVILTGVRRNPGLTILGLAAYWSVLLIHETGHLIAAQRLGCTVFKIELYPIFGVTCFDTPWSRLDHCLIAWAGVAAQCVVAIPLVAWGSVFGYTRLNAVNMLFAILGYFSLVVAFFNLLPVPPLDGATAWGIIPALWARRRATPRRKY